MIRKSGHRFSEKVMLKQKARAGCRPNHNSSRSAAAVRGRTLRFLAMKEPPMRRVRGILSIASLILGIASPALASDYDLQYVPVLRGSAQPPAPVYSVGPATFTRWSGFYVGGDVSWGASQADFSKSTQPLIHDSLQNLTVESEAVISSYKLLENGSATNVGAGVFLGYNTQWQDLILGVEATYTHTNLNMTAATLPLIPRLFGTTAFQLSASGNMDITDYGTARARAGYVLGNFLPYGFVGMAVGRAGYNVSTASSLTNTSCDPTTNICTFNSQNSGGESNALIWGWTAGAGLDWMLTPNIFVRGEFEFVQFAPINNISATIESGRLGGGFKF
jgi:outer membrane immunogenic protein